MSDTNAEIVDPRLERIRNFEGTYPKQLWWLFLSEMWERFCFYGMRGVLVLFMTNQLLVSDKDANLRYGAIQSFVYAMTFAGGFFADKLLGFRRSITWGGILMAVGSFTIAAAPEKFFYIGTAISIIGTGFFKPNISGVVGLLYKDGDPRRDAGFSLFYSGINIGAMLGGALCVYLGKGLGRWDLAFGAAGVAMILGVGVFNFTKHTLEPLGHSPVLIAAQKTGAEASAKLKIAAVYLGSLVAIPLIHVMVINDEYTDLFMKIVGPVVLGYFFFEMSKCTRPQALKLTAALIYILFSVVFWAIFEQAGGSLVIVADKHIAPAEILGPLGDPNVVNNSSNSLFVILISPLVGLAWLKLRKREPDTTVKFGLGFLFLAAAYFIFTSLLGFASPEGVSSIAVFTTAWLVITIGELCLSPIGLSAMTKFSPKRLFGIMMGLWFLASAYGQYIAGLLGAAMVDPNENATPLEKLTAYTTGYERLAWIALICGVAMIAMAPLMRRLTGEGAKTEA